VGPQTVRAERARADATARAVVECAADAIIALSTRQTVLLWNPAAERMFGWQASEVLGRRPPLIPPELAAEHNAVLERARAGGQISFVTRRAHRDGLLLDVRIDVSALRGPGGGLTGWVNVCHLAGEEQAAGQQTAEQARVVRKLGGVVAEMNAQRDLEAVLDRIAASLCDLTGADAGGFVLIEEGRLRLVSMEGLPSSLRGRVADLPTSLVGELMRSGRTAMMTTGESRDFGDLIWSALPGLHTIALALSHVGGRPYGALYALYSRRRVGHTELELLELLAGHAGVALGNAMAFEEVVRQRAHERAVIDASADGIAVLGPDGRIREWNPAAHKLTGLSAAEVAGRPPPFPVPEPGGPTLSHRLPSGRWLDVLCNRLSERDELVVDFRDVTAVKELEEAKDLFLATTSHELRTPITVVQGFASTLASRWDKLTDSDRRSAVQTIADRAAALSRLVEQLLLGSRAGTGQLTVRAQPFDLAALLRAAAAGFGPLSGRHTLVTDVPRQLPAHGDPLATDIIIGQLLENALKYSPDGGKVTVTARARGNWVEVTVDDEGIGIRPGDHERIFERFVQGEAGDRRRFGGIGLGLYIARQLARAQDGEVTAASRPGGGTRMRLRLRRAAPEPGRWLPGTGPGAVRSRPPRGPSDRPR
jgi:PAS domain S-box-containing protein